MSCLNDGGVVYKKHVKWCADDIELFLEIFKRYDVLWNVHHDDYSKFSNSIKRQKALLRLKQELVCHGLVVPDLAFLRARIRNIRATYRNELTRIISSKANGAAAEDWYVPKLSWFRKADAFLRIVVTTQPSQSKLKSTHEDLGFTEEVSVALDLNEKQDTRYLNDNSLVINESTESETATSVKQNQIAMPTAKKRGISEISREENETFLETENKAENLVKRNLLAMPTAKKRGVSEISREGNETFLETENEMKKLVKSNLLAIPTANTSRISKLSKVERAIDKLQKIDKSKPLCSKKVLDEYDVFGQHIANQLRKLPMKSWTILQEKMQSLITKEILENVSVLEPITNSSTSPFVNTSWHQSSET
ncbi:uncharacterized protein LOC108680685 [Hyalella azteca]|uniref:Uncharacterized protein LOC108680685 n=1 Tax=Hyalella azteca TaxID=294128 RepID=A0A8B7PIA2_HYAAZ|nr:uncharacterized protein LOC108680685 [Hyalella azteca]